MKRLCIAIIVLLVHVLGANAENPNTVVILAKGDAWQYEEALAGVTETVKVFGQAVILAQLPPSKSWETEPVAQAILEQAVNPSVKAIIVISATKGTSDGFKKVREIRPDIFLAAIDSWEDPEIIQACADLVLSIDFDGRAYNTALAAKKLGASTLVHVSFTRHMSYSILAYRRSLMILACRELGLEFVDIAVPDPLSEIGIAGAQHYVLEHVPSWIRMYGQKTAFYCVNDALAEALVVGLREHGGMFIEAGTPSSCVGYGDLLAAAAAGGEGMAYADAVRLIGQELAESGADGRFGIWAYSYMRTMIMGLCEYCLGPKASWPLALDADRLFAIFKKLTPGCDLSYSRSANPLTGQPGDDHNLQLQMESYVFGRGFMGNCLPVPKELLSLAREIYDPAEAQAIYSAQTEPKSPNNNESGR